MLSNKVNSIKMKDMMREKRLIELEEILGIKLKIVKEGMADIIVPRLEEYADKYGHIDPARAPVFYNPIMEANRDLAIVCAIAYKKIHSRDELTICEPLCATGVRGVRYALEVKNAHKIIMSDINDLAVKIARLNVFINGLTGRIEVYKNEANRLLLKYAQKGLRFDIIDIDPFGSPIYFIQNATRALKHKGLLAVTATDLAPLVGVYPMTCKRRYFAYSIRSPFSREIGLRILIASVIREGALLEVALIPVLAYYMDHYFRCYFIMSRSISQVDMLLDEIGYVFYCPNCGMRWLKKGIIPAGEAKCPICNGSPLIAGPLWLGRIAENEFIKAVIEEADFRKNEIGSYRRIRKLLDRLHDEVEMPPYYYRVDEAFILRATKNEVSPKHIIEILANNGYRASLTHFNPKGFKTDAKPEDITNLLYEHSLKAKQ